MASQPPQSPAVHSPSAAGQLKSAVLLCATAVAAAATAGGVAYWWLTCVAGPHTRQRRPRGHSKKSSSGKRTQSAATSGKLQAQGQQQQQELDVAGSKHGGGWQQHAHPAGGPVAALQHAARATDGASSASSAAASIESPFARQRAAVAAAAGKRVSSAAAAASSAGDLGPISEQTGAQGTGSGGAQLTSFAETLGTGSYNVVNTSGGSGTNHRSHNSENHRSQHSWHSHGKSSLRSNSSAPELLLLLSNRSVPAFDADDAALQPRSRSWGPLGDGGQEAGVGMQPVVRLEDIEVCVHEDGTLWRLGAGSFGTVYKALLGGVQPVAVKVIPFDASDKERADFDKEVAMLESCRDRNVVQFLGSCSDGPQTLLVTEFLEQGDLHNCLRRDKEGNLRWYKCAPWVGGRPQPGLGKQIALDIARGLAFMHTHCIVHLDVKSPNVLLAADFTAKISDVGLAKLQNKDYLSAQQQVGTFTWSAPEVLMGDRCTEKVDMFSYGVILWELITGEAPARGRLRSVKVPEECPLAVADLMAQCMDADPSGRPSAKEVVSMLSQPDVVLDRHLPPRKAKDKAKGGGNPEIGRKAQKLTTQIATILYGEQGIKERNWAPAEVESISQRTDIGVWTDMLADWARGLQSPDVENPKSAAYRRIETLTSLALRAMRLKAQDNSLWAHGLRNTKSTTSAESTGGSAPDPVKIDQQAVLRALQLTPQQEKAILGVRQDTLKEMEGIAAERARLVEALHQFDDCQDDSFSSGPGSYGDVVAVSQALRDNMVAEGKCTNACFLNILSILSPLQLARMGVVSRPFMFDPIAVGELLEAQASRTASGNLRPGSRSLLEQAMSASSDGGLSRHGSRNMPEPGSQAASQLQTAPSTSTQAASIDGASGGRVSMQMVLKDALERAASGGSSNLGDALPGRPPRSSLEERRPRSSTDTSSCLGRAGER